MAAIAKFSYDVKLEELFPRVPMPPSGWSELNS
jgi:hypothetical protein